MNYSDEHISDYLDRKMPPAEREAFEEAMKRDESLRKSVMIHKTMMADLAHARIHKQISGLELPPDRKTFSPKILALAASIILIISMGIWLLLKPASLHPLYVEYYQKPSRLPSSTMGSTAPNSLLNRMQYAMVAYQDDHYPEAQAQLLALEKEGIENDTLRFYQGIISLELKQSEEAISFFEEILASPQDAFSEHSEWYLVLALLQAGNEFEAMEKLNYFEPDSNLLFGMKMKAIQEKFKRD